MAGTLRFAPTAFCFRPSPAAAALCRPPGSEAGPVSTLSSWPSIPGSNSLRPHPPRFPGPSLPPPPLCPPVIRCLPFRTSQTLGSFFGSSKNPSNLLNSDLQTSVSSSQAPIFPHLSRYFTDPEILPKPLSPPQILPQTQNPSQSSRPLAPALLQTLSGISQMPFTPTPSSPSGFFPLPSRSPRPLHCQPFPEEFLPGLPSPTRDLQG